MMSVQIVFLSPVLLLEDQRREIERKTERVDEGALTAWPRIPNSDRPFGLDPCRRYV